MLTGYIRKAMECATYELVDDKWVGEISPLEGVWTFADTKDVCQKDLQESLEVWIILKLKDGDRLPSLGSIDLNKVGELVEVD